MAIKLTDILTIQKPEEYKLHLACEDPNGFDPLDEFVADRNDWIGWNQYRGARDDWNRPRVLSFMEFYPKADAWLFGGGFEVIESRPRTRYKLKPEERFDKYVGRLLVSFHRYQGMRGRAFNLESFLNQLKVLEIFSKPYSGESFPGLEGINHDFSALEAIFAAQRADWQAALESVNGVYVITDKRNGRHYVGSACGNQGIWSRWACYIENCHAGNDEMMRLIKAKGRSYARKYFRFAILEVMLKATAKDLVQGREAHWKRALLTREFGYNGN
jgi:hypothetical protein